jgi:GTP-binding protein
MSELPLVAVVGRPNVGKSTLFNRLVGRREAIVHDEPGVTRDRRFSEVEWGGRSFRLVDTGGLDPVAKEGILVGIRKQAHRAIQDAVCVLFVIDTIEGPMPLDEEVARDLRRLGKPVLVVANKVDSAKAEQHLGPVYQLGFRDVIAVSGAHGRGIGELLDAVLSLLPAPTEPAEIAEQPPEAGIKLAFIGKPNAGKSSLVNRILGEERVLVHEVPGTTRDPIDTPLEWRGQRFVLIDTAGIRKKRTSYTMTERVAVEMAHRQVERADVVCLILDAKEGPSEQDSRIAGEAADAGRALVIVANKSDLISGNEETKLREKLRDELGHVDWAPIVMTSALTGRQVEKILETARAVYGEYSRRVPTAELNRFFEQILEHHPPPHYKGKAVRLYYITQAETRPPTFVAQANFPEAVAYTYRRYLLNQLRDRFGFRGTPVRLVTRRRTRGRGKKAG